VYFDLARTFCYPWIMEKGLSAGIPLKLSPSTIVIERGSLEQTFEQILLDLHQAEDLFTEKEFTAEDSKYMTKLGVQALLARVYLYKQDWKNALAYAKKVISILSEDHLMPTNNYIFSDYTSESILTLQINNENSTGSNGLGAQFDFRLGGQGDVLATGSFIKLLSVYAGDPRAKLLVIDKEGNQAAFVKYINRSGGAGLSIHNIPVIRLSEIFLIAAESSLMQSDNNQARDYLNSLIKRRTTDFQQNMAKENGGELMERISQERRKELALEGHEIYDIIRLGKSLERNQNEHVNTGLSRENLSFPSFSPKMIYPIPAEEIVASGMEQTKGY
ncbi:MAG: RagB/SusD family nutrient uptake outer membrane protein, partial [Sphingobacterium sp.]